MILAAGKKRKFGRRKTFETQRNGGSEGRKGGH
jgi:hypothetical protein